MITPLEIQNHKFSSKWRGYAPEEVKHFLYAVSEELENLMEHNNQMARELEVLRERLADMMSRDKILKDTLVTAQQVKADIQANAAKEAELVIREAQLKAERLYERAREDVGRVRQQAGEVRRMRNDLLAEAQLMVDRFNHFLEAESSEASESDKIHFSTFATEKTSEPRPIDKSKKPIRLGKVKAE